MNNPGVYVIRENVVGDNGSWVRAKLFNGSKEVFKTSKRSNSFGLYTAGNTLYLDGEPVVKQLQPASNSGIEITDSSISYGGSIIDNSSQGSIGQKCINITLDNYNKLLKGTAVDGYTKLNPDAVYNIVEDTNTAQDVYYNKSPEEKNVIYNNVAGLLPEWAITNATFLSVDTPKISVHDFPFRIVKGSNLEFTYVVDTKDCKRINYMTIGDTFTTIVKDKFGNILYKNTTYAGEFTIQLAPFKNGLGSNDDYVGETWFSVECVDNHGVGSIVVYCDILIVEEGDLSPDPEEFYQVTAEDLETYDISINDSNETSAYKNRINLTRLFADIAAITDSNDEPVYKGLKLHNGGTEETPTTYYTSILANVGDANNINFGTQTYYIAQIYYENGTRKYRKWQLQNGQLMSDDATPIPFNVNGTPLYFTSDGTSAGSATTPYDFIKNDMARIYRVTAEEANSRMWIDVGERIQASAEGKIWVGWRDDINADHPKYGFLSVYNRAHEQFIGFTATETSAGVSFGSYRNARHLRTHTVSKLSEIDNNTHQYILPSGFYYAVANTTQSDGLGIRFPNNFVIDLNGCIIKCGSAYGVNYGRILSMYNNFNTHLRNGIVEGPFLGFDFVRSIFSTGSEFTGASVPVEGVCNIRTEGSRYCSYENIESRYAISYEGITGASPGGAHFTAYNSFSFDRAGYIDYNGNICVPTQAVRELPNGISSQTYNSSANTLTTVTSNAECLVYDKTMHHITRTINNDENDSNPSRITTEICVSGEYHSVPFNVGKRHELFISFYKEHVTNGHTSYGFISTVKTRVWDAVKLPKDVNGDYADTFTLTCYGLGNKSGDTITPTMVTYKTKEDSNTTWRINAAFCQFRVSTYPEAHSRGILYKNCYFHDTRSSAGLSAESVRGITWDGCKYEAIAVTPRLDWFVTKLLGGSEDGRFNTSFGTIKNCIINGTDDDNIKHISGNTTYACYYWKHFTCKNNTGNPGMYFAQYVQSCGLLVTDNVFKKMDIYRGIPYPHLQAVYRNLIISGKFEEYRGTSKNATEKLSSYWGNIRIDNCDDNVDNTVVFWDTFIADLVDTAQDADHAINGSVFRRSKVEGVEYI